MKKQIIFTALLLLTAGLFANPFNEKLTAVTTFGSNYEGMLRSYSELFDALKDEIRPGDAVLFKASRGMKLEEVINMLYEEWKNK